MINLNSDAVVAALISLGGTVLMLVLRWLFNRPARQRQEAERVEQQRVAIEESNAKMALTLRDEMRRDREAAIKESDALRQLLRETELRLNDALERNIRTEARQEELSRSNDSLRQENLALSAQNGAQHSQIESQGKRLSDQESEIRELKVQNRAQAERLEKLEEASRRLEAERAILLEALEKAQIPVPEEIHKNV